MCPWVLLAWAHRLRYVQAAKDQHRILGTEDRKQQDPGREESASARTTGLAGNRRLGMRVEDAEQARDNTVRPGQRDLGDVKSESHLFNWGYNHWHVYLRSKPGTSQQTKDRLAEREQLSGNQNQPYRPRNKGSQGEDHPQHARRRGNDHQQSSYQ